MKLLEMVCDIIKTKMQLKDDQIWKYNQKVDIPNDNRIYVVASLGREVPFGANIKIDSTSTQLKESTWVNLRSVVRIDTFSYNTAAYDRRYEILSALRSVYSVQQQEKNKCQISRIPIHFVDASFLSVTANLYSYHYEYAITHVWNSEEIEPDYYETFDREIKINQ